MSKVTPEEYQQKYADNLKGSTAIIRRGIERVTVAPTEKAAAKKDKYLEGIRRAAESGKWERGLRRVPLDEWQKKTIEKGIGRIAAGVDAAKDKTIDFARQLLPFQDTLKQEIERMPDVSLEDSINRMSTWCRRMADFKRD